VRYRDKKVVGVFVRFSCAASLAAIFGLSKCWTAYCWQGQFGPLIYGPVTYFPLTMAAIMLLLGYLDIYSQAIKDMDKVGKRSCRATVFGILSKY
jgi:hypothetical protein